MAKIVIAELDIDTDALIASAAETKTAILRLREEQAKLKKEGQESSAQFQRNNAEIKNLSATYNAQTKAISAQITEQGKYISQTDAITVAVEKENVTEQQMLENNRELIALRKTLNVNSADYAKNLDLINNKIDENNAFIKSNVSQYEQQKIGIGDYKTAIKESVTELGLFNTTMGGTSQIFAVANPLINVFSKAFKEAFADVKGFSGAAANAKNDLGGLANGANAGAEASGKMSLAQKALTVATTTGAGAFRVLALAIAATGIGALVIAVVALITFFSKFAPVVDKVEQAFAGLGAVFGVVQKVIAGFVMGLSDLEGSMKKLANAVTNPRQALLGLAADMAKAFKSASDLKKAQQDLEDAMKVQEVQSAKNRAEINRLNIQAKDRTKSEQERIKLLEKVAEIEKADFEQRKANSDKQLEIARKAIIDKAGLNAQEIKLLDQQGLKYKDVVEKRIAGTDELFDNLQKALLDQTDIENEFYSNQEKNINRQNKLLEDQEAARQKAAEEEKKRQEEAEARRQQALQDALAKTQAELDFYLSSQGTKVKALDEELKIAENVRNKRIEIAKAEFEASKKTEADKLRLLTATNDANNEFLDRQAQLVVENGQRELDAFLKLNATKLEQNKFFTELQLREEQRRLELIAQERRDYEALQYEQGLIDYTAYQENLAAIDEETRLEKQQKAEQQKQLDLEREAIDRENRLEIAADNTAQDFEIQAEILEARRLQELEAAERTGADIQLINQKYAQAKQALDNQSRLAQVSNVQNAFKDVSEITSAFFGSNKKLQSALALIDATIGAQKAYISQLIPGDPSSPLRAALAAGKALALGIANVARINGVKFEKGGIMPIGGKRHSQGGTKFYGEDGTTFEAEAGEGIGVLSRPAFGAFMRFNNQFTNGSVGTRYAENGGIISRAIQNNNQELIAAQFVADVLQNLPQPVVYVDDINFGQNRMAVNVQAASV